jgi:DNA-binding transcriptional LysR family regulator
MDWQQLKCFHATVKLGSVTRASSAMFRTQSALSQQISRLESRLQCKLFQRIGKHMKLTTEGEILFKFAEEMLLRERTVLEQLDVLSEKSAGTIHIGAPHALHCFLLMDVLHDYHKEFPRIILKIYERHPQNCIDMVLQGELNFCFTHQSTIPITLNSVPWRKARYMFLVPYAHPLLAKKSIGIEDIIQYPINLPSKNFKFTARDKFEAVCNKYSLEYHVSVDAGNVFVNIEYAARGMGIAFMLCYDKMIAKYSGQVHFISLPQVFPDETISIAFRKDGLAPKYKKDFLEFVTAYTE